MRVTSTKENRIFDRLSARSTGFWQKISFLTVLEEVPDGQTSTDGLGTYTMD
ncbi:MAG: hypothetical protein HC849_30375 [Oscillatoriales cyanobacterium RU_3_3]|nr:hypothetical protein [Microcoleus sp. SU_5_6]NJL68979.1 hypothetical protein [Microcoleus sp. SM1_3_4]NJM63502.1 hypothetical protein [Oscillatoriales cyanobacterium RU_3_3]NJR26142.1 hypothetical protein [Richelia sp. CSU_2_1]